MKRLIALLTVAGSAAVLLASQPASAVTTVIGFDNVPEGTIATSQYTGVVFSGASVLTENSELILLFRRRAIPMSFTTTLTGRSRSTSPSPYRKSAHTLPATFPSPS